MKEAEYKYITGSPNEAIDHIKRVIKHYKADYAHIRVGITSKNPQAKFDDQLAKYNDKWKRMLVIYKTFSINFAKLIKTRLIEEFKDSYINGKAGGESELSKTEDNYVYVLLG